MCLRFNHILCHIVRVVCCAYSPTCPHLLPRIITHNIPLSSICTYYLIMRSWCLTITHGGCISCLCYFGFPSYISRFYSYTQNFTPLCPMYAHNIILHLNFIAESIQEKPGIYENQLLVVFAAIGTAMNS